jgi:hypothetical protein
MLEMNRYRVRQTTVAAIIVGTTIGSTSAQTTDIDVSASLVTISAEDVTATDTENVTAETLAWDAAQQSNDSKDVFAFIEAFPNGTYAKDARALMIDLLWIEMSNDSAKLASNSDQLEIVPEADVVAPAEVVRVADSTTNEIELRSVDGFVALTGVIVDFDGAIIKIQTSTGLIGIENDGIVCIGAACPTALLANP